MPVERPQGGGRIVDTCLEGSDRDLRAVGSNYFCTPVTACTAFPWLASTARATTSAKSGKAPFASLENTWTPLISTSKDVLRPMLPVTVAFGSLARICFFSSSKRGMYPHPPQYSTNTLTGFAPAIDPRRSCTCNLYGENFHKVQTRMAFTEQVAPGRNTLVLQA